jgi:hypothetical protein
MKSILQRMYTSGKTSVRTLRCFLFLYSCSNANSDALIMHIERGICHSDALISHMEREAFVTPRAKHPVAIGKSLFMHLSKGILRIRFSTYIRPLHFLGVRKTFCRIVHNNLAVIWGSHNQPAEFRMFQDFRVRFHCPLQHFAFVQPLFRRRGLLRNNAISLISSL